MPNPFADIGSCILQELGAQNAIVVSRFSGGSWDSTGRYSGQTSTQTPTEAVVQPMPAKEALKLPENERTKEGIMIFTRSPLLTSDVSLQRKADHVTWNGRTYEVLLTEDWTAQAQYSKSLAVRLGA